MSDLEKQSKLLSFVLRHRPDAYGVRLDAEGWASVSELLAAFATHGVNLDLQTLRAIVSMDEKRRYAFSADQRLIRAQQGHSVAVELGYTEATPPELLFHGTVTRFVPQIAMAGLVRSERQHVHLSEWRETALSVGARRGRPIVLEVRALALHATGVLFFRTPNDVWLTEHVPPAFLVIPTSAGEA